MKTIAVWFSCGAASAVAAKKTIEKYGNTHRVRVINNPVANEHSDNKRFLKDVEKWLGVDIEFATNRKWPDCDIRQVFDKSGWMGGIHGANCTWELKKEARRQWEESNNPDFHVLGFTVEEWKRAKRFRSGERENLIPILVHEMITKKECFKIIKDAGLELPKIYKLGYPNANCIGCVKATSPTYWNHVRKVHPDIFKERAEQSRKIGALLVRVNNERIQLDELDPNAKGNKMKDMNFECGIFCEESK